MQRSSASSRKKSDALSSASCNSGEVGELGASACGPSDPELESRSWVSPKSSVAIRVRLQYSLPGDVRSMLARTALRWVPARKPLRLCWAGSCGCSGARGARSVWAVTAGSNPLRPTTSAGITTVQIFARDDAVAAQRKCPWLQTPTPLRIRQHARRRLDPSHHSTGTPSRPGPDA